MTSSCFLASGFRQMQMHFKRMSFCRKQVSKLKTFCEFAMNLKVEQRDAVGYLLDGNDVLAVFPMGFGTNLIF